MMLITLAVMALLSQSHGKIIGIEDDTVTFADENALQDILDDVSGFTTEFLNCDQSLLYKGSMGDFETIRRCRILEVLMKECLIPCETPRAMRCRALNASGLPAKVIYQDCLDLGDDDTNPASGLYAKNSAAQAKYGGACNSASTSKPKDLEDTCKRVLGQECNAPDSECQWFCMEADDERAEFCAGRMAEILATRTLAIKALKTIVQDKKKQVKRGFSTKLVRKALSQLFFERALKKDEDDNLILLSRLLRDDTIDWEN